MTALWLTLFVPLGLFAAQPSADFAVTHCVVMANLGLPIIGAVWFFVALVFVLSLARASVRKVHPKPGFDDGPRVSVRSLGLLLLLVPLWASTLAAPPLTNSASNNRVLIIDPSSMPVAKGKATLTIGTLLRAGGIYTGGYRINVSPYFYKNEKGKLNIVVSDESMAKLSRGKVAAITGTATTAGQGGETRHIDATATPANNDRGTLKLWFMSGERKMIFEPAYHFAEKQMPAMLAPTNMTSKPNLKRRLPISHREAVEAAAKHL